MKRWVESFVRFLRMIFGQWSFSFSWNKPEWVKKIWHKFVHSRVGNALRSTYLKLKNKIKENPRRSKKWALISAAAIVVVTASGLGLKMYLDSLPRPDYVTITVHAPYATNSEDKTVYNLELAFSKSAAPMDQINKNLKDAVKMDPEMPGTWKWTDDRSLVFTPKDVVAFKSDWLVGTKYKLQLNKKIFPSHLIFETYKLEFTTTPLTAYKGQKEFYIDPTNNKIRKALFKVRANQPFQAEDFKKRISLTIQDKDSSLVGKSGTTLPPQINFNAAMTEADIQTAPLNMAGPDRIVKLKLEKGLHSLRGGENSTTELEDEVEVPGRFSAFKISTPRIIFARNAQFEPEQVLVFETGVGVKTEDIAKVLKVHLLPEKHKVPNHKGKEVDSSIWSSHAEVSAEVLKSSELVTLTPVPTEEPYSSTHSFKVHIPVRRYLYFHLPKGVKAAGEYELGEKFESIVYSPNYGAELMFMSEGSLLTLSGDRKLPLLSRNVQKVKFEVGRIIPAQVNFLISRMFSENSFNNPSFYDDVENMIVERSDESQNIPKTKDAETQYFSLDMKTFNQGKSGFFYVRVNAVEKTKTDERDNVDIDEPFSDMDEGEGEDGGDYERPATADGKDNDKRLILITDLGLIAKHTAAHTIMVFVQNLRTGLPVENATVDVIGQNGLTIVSQTTDGQGKVTFPSLTTYQREKRPLAIVARNGSDMSYLPYQLSQRQLVYSRFNTGGEYQSTESDQLSAMLFSDRGLYRPGDTVNIGMILRSKTQVKDVGSLPMVVSVIDPRGNKIKSEKMPIKLFSLQDFKFSTQDTSPTGNYAIQLHVMRKSKNSTYEQLIGSTDVQVEEFVPDKLKILAQLTPSKTKGWIPLDKTEARVSLKNLFGAPAENRTIKGRLTITPVSPNPEKYKDYSFANPNKDKQQTVTEELAEQITTDKGEAVYNIDLTKYAGYFAVRFHAEGFEAAGGRSVEAYAGTMASQWKFLVGYKADGSLNYIKKGAVRNVNLIALGEDMTPVKGDIKLILNEIKHVSTLVKQRDNNYKYQSIKKEVLLSTEDKKFSPVGFSLPLPSDKAGDFVYIVQNANGDELNRIPFTVIGEANLTRSLDRNAELQIVLNKDDYQPGEEIELQILAPYSGAGLITIERETVFTQKWFKTTANTTVEKIRIPDTLSGNAYVNVTFLRSTDSKEIYMSPLSYGVQPFSISLDSQRTKVSLKTPEKVKPGETISIKYSANRATSLVIYGVDEGILQVARYKLPNPLLHFFKKQTLQVDTYQLLDLLLPDYALLANSSAAGGDMMEAALAGNLNPFKAKGLKAVAFWSGVLEAGPTEKTFTYDVPEYFNGNIKVMAVASTRAGLGSTETGTISRGDFIITPTAPIFVTPSDEIEMGVSISNQSENPKSSPNVKVSTTTSNHLSLVGPADQNLQIPVGREVTTSFKLKAQNKLGVADLKIQAGNGTESATFSHQVSVRPAVPYMTTLAAGFAEDLPLSVPVERQLSPELADQSFSLSPLPFAITDGLMEYLKEFPYGCTEQVVSQTIPSLIMTGKLTSPGLVKKAHEAHEQLISILRRRQTPEGGFKLYEEGDTHLPASLYAIAYLVEAKDRQLPTPSDMEENILNFLKSSPLRRGESLPAARNFAQAIYLQARYGIVPSNDLNFLVQLLDKTLKGAWEKDATAIYLAGTYHLLKQEAKGWALLKSMKLGEETAKDYYNYYDITSHDTVLIKIVARHYPTELARFINNEGWKTLTRPVKARQYNTFSAAQLIMAFASMSTAAEKANFPGTLTLKETGAAGEKALTLPEELVARTKIGIDAKKVDLTGPGYTPLFYSLTQKGFDSDLPKTEIKKVIEIARVFEDKDGKTISKVKMGDEVNVVLRWRTLNRMFVPYVVVVDMFPAGFELLRDSLAPNSPANQIHGPIAVEYIDKREDRIVVYGNASENMTEVKYRLKATHKGKFNLPPIFGESMYDKDIQYRGVSAHIEVL